MKNLKVGNKLIISFSTVLVLFVISVVVVVVNLSGIKSQLEVFYNGPWPVHGAALSLKGNLAEQQKSLLQAVATTDQALISSSLADVNSYNTEINNNLTTIKNLFLGDKAIVTQLEQYLKEWDAQKTTVVNMAADTGHSSDDVSRYLQENCQTVIQNISGKLQEVIDFAGNRGDMMIENTEIGRAHV